MASAVDICNLALARLGDVATVAAIDPSEGSAQADQCARFYPIARDSLLELHGWKFNTRRVALSSLSIDLHNWAYAYAEPTGCLRVLKVIASTDESSAVGWPFETETDEDGRSLIRTNMADAEAVCTFRVTDPAKFSPLFVDALGWLLASYLAGPIIKGEEGRAESRRMLQEFRLVMAQATGSDANQRKLDIIHSPAWVEARGGTDTLYTRDGRIIR